MPYHNFDLFTYRSVAKYLSQTSIRESLGVDDAVPQNFSTVGWAVNRAFEVSGDEFQSSHDYIAALLDRGVRVLVYVGNYDAIANWVGNERWTLDMDWTGKIEYGSQTLREWIVGGKAAGLTRSAKGLTFATVFESGHMVRLNASFTPLIFVTYYPLCVGTARQTARKPGHGESLAEERRSLATLCTMTGLYYVDCDDLLYRI